ncbi:MAG: hypothetical protein IKE51_02510 [Solobacterium sp.]|nr:hypothetical protein [Solobacterium sp.]
MDRKVEKNSYKERLKLGSQFYILLIELFVIAVLICAIGLSYLWYWLERYERRSVNGALTNYTYMVMDHKWDEIYQMDIDNFVELNSKEAITNYLIWLYGDRNMTGATFTYAGGDDYSQYYDVYFQEEKLCSLETRKPEGSEVWVVRTVSQDHTYMFDVLDDTEFSINNVKISDSYYHEENHIPFGFEEIEKEDVTLPKTTRYTVGGFIYAPIVQIPNDKMIVRDSTENLFYIGPKPTNSQITEFTEHLRETAFAYCRYITEDGTLYELNQHLYPYTTFYNGINGFDNQWFSIHDSIEFKNIEYTDMMPIGENAFIGTISFDYEVIWGDIIKTYSGSYQLFFIKDSQDLWKATNLAIISDSAQDR